MTIARRTTLVILAGCLALLGSCPPAQAAGWVGRPAPSFKAVTLGGEQFDLSKLRGKVVLINFWATWCAPCRKEMPALDAFYRRYRGEGLEMIAVSLDEAASRRHVLGIMRQLYYPAATQDEVQVNGFGKPTAIPLNYVIDAEGTVREQFFEAPRGLLEKLILPLLRKAKPEGAPYRQDGGVTL
jgi:cytochrome c biogenesis protein CcmG, thiol:disulfide interchange protein DsbE